MPILRKLWKQFRRDTAPGLTVTELARRLDKSFTRPITDSQGKITVYIY